METIDFTVLPREQLELMADAGARILECYRVLGKAGLNIVGEVLKGQGEFYELEHYPNDDVFDADTHSQYYYHAHRTEANEHGHFHTFLRQSGMLEGAQPVPYDGEETWPQGADALSHLIAISMDAYGFPTGLFATNRWVTAEAWYKAEDVISMLDRFDIDHAWPSWPVNIWISAMMVLFRPQIEALLCQRDEVVASWARTHPGVDVFEDRMLELTGFIPIDVKQQIGAVAVALST
ncbi:MAG TPA: hypothetical protein VGK14_05660 [Novimethylophilus sp.]|jgi:hypothetical protein|uniref:DUF6969 family protein n=1 Tax=Novimethylophilus sp. TaxID=2137426 RepID=UPI002F41EE1D